jgi:hypothetical protein
MNNTAKLNLTEKQNLAETIASAIIAEAANRGVSISEYEAGVLLRNAPIKVARLQKWLSAVQVAHRVTETVIASLTFVPYSELTSEVKNALYVAGMDAPKFEVAA